MKQSKTYPRLAIFCFIMAGALSMVLTVYIARVLAQTQSTLTIGGFTLSVPNVNPPVLVNAPARNGTLALTEDLQPIQPGPKMFAGQILVNGSAAFSGTSGPFICTLSPRFITTASGLQVSGIDYVCTQKNN